MKHDYAIGAWRELGLTDEEFERIEDILGRRPNWTELGMYSVLWSEHCSYKHTRPLFSLFPTEGDHILQGVGENAGVVDIGDGLAVTFKIESHNSPSAIEPYQGAATGVGGILRDIFTMGARPIAVLNSLRLGSLKSAKARRLLEGVVSGMSDYGNRVGVPTVAGEIAFDPAYEDVPLVNAMAVGLVKHEHVATASASGSGNSVMVVGARTGRDGIHGASMSSAEVTQDVRDELPPIQIGDPFTERVLIEACLEIIQRGLVVGMQDMGAAGLTSSSSEMAARAGSGIEMNLDLVPLRDPDMTPYEIMLSESQERMLLVPKAGQEETIQAICAKWGLEATVIGRVTDDEMLRLIHKGRVVAEVPAKSLADDAPVYYPDKREPEYIRQLQRGSLPVDIQGDVGAHLHRLLADPTIANKAWVYRQFDHTAQSRTAILPGEADAGVLWIRENGKGLAVTVDCNALHCYVDPYVGAAAAVAEASRNLVCTGAKPLALTDGLNFGSPERPETFWQISRAAEGIADAARALETPVIGGNVSLYNEADGNAVWPTPMIGMVGILDRVEHRITQSFKAAGHLIYLLGEPSPSLGGSRYLFTVHGLIQGPLPQLDLALERKVQNAVLLAGEAGLLQSAHDVSEGGLAVTLAESALTGRVGLDVRIDPDGNSSNEPSMRTDAFLFGEGYSQIVVSVAPKDQKDFETLLGVEDVPVRLLGHVVSKEKGVRIQVRDAVIEESLVSLAADWYGAIPHLVDGPGAGDTYIPVDLREPR